MALPGNRAIRIYIDLYDRPYSREELAGEH